MYSGLLADGWLARWIRRLVTVPTMLAAAVLGLASFPLAILVAALVDLALRRSWIACRFVVALALNAIMHAAGLIGLFGAWLIGGRWLGVGPARQEGLDFALQCWWARSAWRAARYSYRMTLAVEGDETLDGGPFVLLSRHVSLLDTILRLVVLADRHGKRLRYVMKAELLFDPCVDVVGHRFPTAFVRRGTQRHGPEIERVRRLREGLGPEEAIVVYPEGTRYSAEKKARVVRSLERNQPDVAAWARGLRHLLPPHPGRGHGAPRGRRDRRRVLRPHRPRGGGEAPRHARGIAPPFPRRGAILAGARGGDPRRRGGTVGVVVHVVGEDRRLGGGASPGTKFAGGGASRRLTFLMASTKRCGCA